VRWRVAGVPVLSIIGVLSILGMGVIEYAYLNDPNSGISLRAPTMILINVAVFLSGFVFYAVTRVIRARQGVDLSVAFAEIPPEGSARPSPPARSCPPVPGGPPGPSRPAPGP